MSATTAAVGSAALAALTTGTDNAALGAKALTATTTGIQNVAVGSQAGSSNISGGDNVIIGYGSAPSLTSGSGNVVIGAGADVLAANTSNYLNIGGVISGDMSTGWVSAGVSKAPCNYATTTALPGNTYSSGVLTATANGALSVDGSAVLANQRILVWQEATPAYNGIYTVTNTGSGSAPFVLTRAADFGSSATILGGDTTYVQSGTTYAKSNFQMTTAERLPSVQRLSLSFKSLAPAAQCLP